MLKKERNWELLPLIFSFFFQNVLQCTSQGESTDFLAHQKENLVVIKGMHENSGVAAN